MQQMASLQQGFSLMGGLSAQAVDNWVAIHVSLAHMHGDDLARQQLMYTTNCAGPHRSTQTKGGEAGGNGSPQQQ